jgi:hypothetical protein
MCATTSPYGAADREMLMLVDTFALPRCRVRAEATEQRAAGSLDSRRQEIRAFLEDIRRRQPSPAEIVEAVDRATEGELSSHQLRDIANSVLALYNGE